MPLKLTCPNCGAAVPLTEPLPQPGDEVQCAKCAVALAVNYPPGVVEQLRARGKRFQGAPALPQTPPKAKPPAKLVKAPPPGRGPRTAMTAATEAYADSGPRTVGSVIATEIEQPRVDATQSGVDELGIDRTVPGSRSPYGHLAGGAPEADAARVGPASEVDPTQQDEPSLSDPRASRDPRKGAPARKGGVIPRKKPQKPAKGSAVRRTAGAAGCLGTTAMGLLALLVGTMLLGMGVLGGGYWYYSQDLPTIETLRAYQPPTVTVVEDKDGEVLGEIFDQRRYVVPVEEMPAHVKNAFLAAEDANFYDHGGIDYEGIVRAVLRNAAKGRMAQGASTITQQVARNFLLTRDKKLERKAKEIILSWRIEEAYEKDHILFLYLNEIFLGNQAYGVEAASRAYFGKSVKEVTLAEAAILAGLPQRPTDYAPNKHFEKARERQEYVLDQMLDKGYISKAEHDAAWDEKVAIVANNNAFRQQAPWFTEHVRRYLVEKYGEDAVLRQGLRVRTTCDLDLQQLAQESVTRRADDVDMRMGFRRQGLEHLTGDDAIAKKRAEHEQAMRRAMQLAADPAGREPLPAKSALKAGERYPAVILEVAPKWARVGVGDHEAVVPIAWSDWVYEPDPTRSWRGRTATDLTAKVDVDGDGKDDGPILQAGDVVEVQIEGTDTTDPAVSKVFAGTPGASQALAAARLHQRAEVEAALFSMDIGTGAVRAMVGGTDFGEGQFNRAVQGRRQVGSTFKPFVYAAAIQSKKVTAASVIPDAPIAFATTADFVWKPSNYSNDYMGNITIRRALALSRNTVTIRVLETMDPGLNRDVIYQFARKLGIGGPPLHTLPEDHVPSPENDLLCPWVEETPKSTICMDHFPPRTDKDTNTGHRAKLTADDHHMCRACDYSMALGSASLTMEELVRAYAAFPSGGLLVEPYYVEEVRDRDGKVLETHSDAEFHRVMEPEVASITTWLLEGVVSEGTGNEAKRELGLSGLGGKTGTTNDEKDAWFVGFTPNVITAVWVGFDQPRSLGVSSTGGKTALPIWIDYMRQAAPKSDDRGFPMRGNVENANIEEATGRKVSSGGRSYPFLPGTVPEGTGGAAGEISLEDLPEL